METSSICVVDSSGNVVREAKLASEPGALVAWFQGLGLVMERIGMEAGPLSQWLHAGMREKELAVELLETRHVRTAVPSVFAPTVVLLSSGDEPAVQAACRIPITMADRRI